MQLFRLFAVLRSLSSLYRFTGADAGTSIRDGGNDMYDGGNELRVQVNGVWSEPLKYTQVCHGGIGEGTGRGDAEYNTCMLPNGSPIFVAAVSSPSGSISGFRVNGNLGADGGGHIASSSLPLQTTANLYLYPPWPRPPPQPRPPPGPPGTGLCLNTCYYAGDGCACSMHLCTCPTLEDRLLSSVARSTLLTRPVSHADSQRLRRRWHGQRVFALLSMHRLCRLWH